MNAIRQTIAPLEIRRITELICPDRLFYDFAVQPSREKDFACAVGQINCTDSRVLPRSRGALRDRHERWVRDAVDVGGAADESAGLRTAKPCGPDAPTLASSWRSDPQAMVARKPGHQGEHVISRKPLRREGRIVSANLWRLRSCAFLFACEAMGAASTRLSLRPLFAEALRPASLGQILPRECGRISLLAV